MDFPHCGCFDEYGPHQLSETRFHAERQDTGCEGWKRILELVERAVADGREEFAPQREMTMEQWSQLVTLPATIGRLKLVRRLLLYGSWLVRIPPEVGEMENLEEFEPYTSHRLHWFPYEISRCKRLKHSTVSTRSLYGNFKFRPPFPRLQPASPSASGVDLANLSPAVWGAAAAATCSVCGTSLAGKGLHQVWLSATVATDVLPLLVNACSDECVGNLPPGADGYVKTPHSGGLDVKQPPPDRSGWRLGP